MEMYGFQENKQPLQWYLLQKLTIYLLIQCCHGLKSIQNWCMHTRSYVEYFKKSYHITFILTIRYLSACFMDLWPAIRSTSSRCMGSHFSDNTGNHCLNTIVLPLIFHSINQLTKPSWYYTMA